MRTRHSLAIGVTALAVLAGVVPTATAATKKPTGGVFVDLANFSAGEPDHIDPGLTSTLTGAQVAILMYDGLTDTDASGTLVPASASKWTTIDSGKTWVFTVKKGLKFSNGEPVLPSSFKRGWERAVAPATASEVAYHFDLVQGKKAVDDKTATTLSGVVADDKAMTITVTLTIPFSGFPAVASHPVYSPIPKSMATAGLKVEEEGTKLIGNGPYMLKEQISKTAGGSVKLVRNPKYASKKGTLAEIDFLISKDGTAAYQAFQSGQGLDSTVPAGQFKAAAAQYGDQGLGPVIGLDYWGFNWNDPVVGGPKNVLLRKAIIKAADRSQVSELIYQGQRKPIDQMVPPGIPNRVTGVGFGTGRDLAGAKADFAAWQAAGNKLDAPLRLSYNEGAVWDKVANIFVANLKEVGIDAKLDPFPADGTYFTKMRKGDGQIIRAGWFADYVLYDNFLYPLLHSASIGGDNLESYSNPKFDQLVNQARGTADSKASAALYAQAEKIAVQDDAVVMPITVRASNFVFSPKVQNLKITPLGFILYQNITLAP